MFTGLVEGVCRVAASRSTGGGAMAITVDLRNLADGIRIGDSVSVNGVCLTVAGIEGTMTGFEAGSETLARSAIARLSTGTAVNIERALRPSDRLGGHIVQGHTDGVATIRNIRRQQPFAEFVFAVERQLAEQLVPKGSVAVDGISLTIAAIDRETFSVAVVPHTLGATNLGTRRIGDAVNIEIDILVKTVKRLLDRALPAGCGLTAEKLRGMGL